MIKNETYNNRKRQIREVGCLTPLLLTFFISCSVSKIQKENLKSELALILKSDQDLRELFSDSIVPERKKELLDIYKISDEDFKTRGWEITQENDSINLIKVESIISTFGYPGKKMVGDKLNTAAWFVIQHSKPPVIKMHFPLIEKAGKKGDLERIYVAMMQDRMLMYDGKEQIYGTQIAGRLFVDPETKQEEWKTFVWPIKSWENVNELRKSVGFKNSIEDYCKLMNLENPRKYSLEEIEKLTKK